MGGQVIILGHHNADPDVIGSAQGIKQLVQSLNKGAEAEIVLPGDASSLTAYLSSILEIKYLEKPKISEPDTIIVVDTGGLNQLGDWRQTIEETNTTIIFIDHHLPDSEINKVAKLYLLDSEATSSSEIIYKLMMHYRVSPTKTTASALLAGIAFDTKHFSIGGAETFMAISELLEKVGDVSEIMDLLTLPMNVTEKIARLKAGQRADVTQFGDWLIAVSCLGSFHSSGARALISLGADLALIVGEENNGIRGSLRSTRQFYKSTRFHLGEFASILGKRFNGSGSGHSTAAGINAHGDLDKFILTALSLIKTELQGLY